jgi:hypothetical protein
MVAKAVNGEAEPTDEGLEEDQTAVGNEHSLGFSEEGCRGFKVMEHVHQ